MRYVQKTLSDVITLTSIVNVHYFEFPYHYHTRDEKHPFYELVFAARGDLTVFSEDFTGRLREGQAVLHRPNTLHRFDCDKDAVTTLVILGFNCAEPLPAALSRAPTALGAAQKRKAGEIVKEAREVFCPPYDTPTYDMKKRADCAFGAEQMLKNLIEAFLIDLVRAAALPARESGRKSAFRAGEVKRYLDLNYKEKIALDKLAFLFCTNRATLCARFKEETGLSVMDYVAQRKFEEAARLLRETDLSVTEIAERLRFQSIHYFTRFFCKKSGTSPSRYRAAAGK